MPKLRWVLTATLKSVRGARVMGSFRGPFTRVDRFEGEVNVAERALAMGGMALKSALYWVTEPEITWPSSVRRPGASVG